MKSLISRLAPSSRTSIAALSLLAWLGAGCATAGVTAKGGTALPVSVVFAGTPLCPTNATVPPANQCTNVRNPERCLKAKRGDSVVFTSSPAGLDFTLYFDPFKKGALDSKKGVLVQNVSPDAPYKTYSYNLTAPGCPIIDPDITIDP